MKLRTLLLLLAISSPAISRADSINPFNGWLSINGPGGQFSYSKSGLSGTDGSTYWFGASGAPAYGIGKFGNGYLTVTTSLFTLEGALNTVYFNPQTGALAGNFIGILDWSNGQQETHLFHARFYETVNPSNHSVGNGYLVFATGNVPEPSSIWLTMTGIAGIAGAGWRKIRTVL